MAVYLCERCDDYHDDDEMPPVESLKKDGGLECDNGSTKIGLRALLDAAQLAQRDICRRTCTENHDGLCIKLIEGIKWAIPEIQEVESYD